MIEHEADYPEDDLTEFDIYEEDPEITDPIIYAVKGARLDRFQREGKETMIPDFGKENPVTGDLFDYDFYNTDKYRQAKIEILDDPIKAEELKKKTIATVNHLEAGYSRVHNSKEIRLRAARNILNVYILLELGYKSDAWKLYLTSGFEYSLPIPD
jgi:hypothetical protein